ncbi:MAG: type II secretion system protein [Planctomycetota bacterium]
MKQPTKRSAFTLVELLTVMAIIAVLISILTPALSSARNRAKTTAVKAQINAMSVGLEAFHGDQGEYAPSNPVMYAKDIDNTLSILDTEMSQAWKVGNLSTPYQGAHLLVDALVGRDLLGYDPRAETIGAGGGGALDYDRWDEKNTRRQPYIPIDGVDLTSELKPPEDSFGVVPDVGIPPQPTDVDGKLVRAFRDKFGWPILYYCANPVSNQSTPIIQTVAGLLHTDGVYDGNDNAVFTSYGAADPRHRIWEANLNLVATPPYGPSLDDENNFAEFIRSFRASSYDPTTDPPDITHPRPVNQDSFIILSAGKDGIYGTLDDVANFSVLSEDR